MSRTDRRSTARVSAGRGGGSRQEWVPRGFFSAPPLPAPAPAPAPNQKPTNPYHRNHRPASNPNRHAYPPPPACPVTASSSSPSEIPQLVQEIKDKLARGAIECMIWYDMVRRSSPIWSCSNCFSIFHLHCIRKWSRSPTSNADASSSSSSAASWRCPGCQSVQSTASKDLTYTCFCGRRRDPPNDFYLTPHCCGEPCGCPSTAVVAATVTPLRSAAPTSVSSSAILGRARPARHLPRASLALAARRQLCGGAQSGRHHLPVGSGVIGCCRAGGTGARSFAILGLAALVGCRSWRLASVERGLRWCFVGIRRLKGRLMGLMGLKGACSRVIRSVGGFYLVGITSARRIATRFLVEIVNCCRRRLGGVAVGRRS